ncbi:MAG: glycosyltransferase family 4 protein [candidate division WOR-3 bacterium]
MKKVIVSHPGRQHSHQLAYALQEGKILLKYFTGLWYKPDKFPYSILKKMPQLEKEFKKRYFEKINPEYVVQNPFPEIKYRFILKDKNPWLKIGMEFDRWVSKKLKKLDFDIFIGYELSSLKSFRIAKLKKKITILDLSQIHYKDIIKINNKFKFLNVNKRVLKIENKIKDEELKYADYIIVLSEFAKESLIKNGIDRDRIFVAHLGIEPSIFKPTERHEDKEFTLIFVGTICKRKGINYLIETYKRINKPDIHLTIIGPPADAFKYIEKNIKNLKYKSFLPHEKLVKEYYKSSIFVFPSLLDSFAQVVLEAMACGLPVIITENVGAKDCVRNGVDGFIIPPGDITALKEKILYFYYNREKIYEMGKNASEQARKYTWEKYRENILKFIKEL